MLRQPELVEKVLAYAPNADEDMLNRAYVFTTQKHGSQKRASGDPYFSHPIEVAGLITDLKLDSDTVVAALLHDTVEDTDTSIEDIRRIFNDKVAELVDGVTKLSSFETPMDDKAFKKKKNILPKKNTQAAENLRKFLLAMSNDVRVLIIKLADRLHNMRTLHYIPKEEKRKRIAKETLDIYAPLAERIGMYEYMREMQQLSFQHLEPNGYKAIIDKLNELKKDSEDVIGPLCLDIKTLLGENDLTVSVTGREKHPYSIWRKMGEREMRFQELMDIFAFRVTTENIEDCYRALGIIHCTWKSVPGRFKDYISTPKRNGYRAIHTTVIDDKSRRVEIQICTDEMLHFNNYGLAAHWKYKQGVERSDGQIRWLDELREILEHAESPDELLEHTRMAMYQDRIFAFTPKGELYQFPKGATALDFAYSVHTNLGNMAVGARVNGRLVPLYTELENGCSVRILKSKNRKPNEEWLGYVVTAKAKSAIKRYLKEENLKEKSELGHDIFLNITAKLPIEMGEKAIEQAIKTLKMEDKNEFFAAIATKKISDTEVIEALMPGSTIYHEKFKNEIPNPNHAPENVISIEGLTPGIAYSLGKCCHPVPGDRIIGLRKKGVNVEIHTMDCMTLANGVDAEWVNVNWGAGKKNKSAVAVIETILYNRPGTMADMAGVFAYHNANIVKMRLVNRDHPFHTYENHIEVHDTAHLSAIIAALRVSDSVSRCRRL